MDSRFDLADYAPVAERIALFYERFPEGRITTELVSRRGSEITFVARIYRTLADSYPSATGWASELIGDGDVNSVACLENTETSAVGRALANLGFLASRNRPSREEMTKAARGRERVSGTRQETDHDVRPSQGRVHRAVPERQDAAHSLRVEVDSILADATLDAMRLLRAARRSGLDQGRAESVARRLRCGVSLASIRRLESVLRDWLIERSRAAVDDVAHVNRSGNVKDPSL